MANKIRTLIVDDSALVRDILQQGLSADPGIEIVGTASDPYIARDRIQELRPQVMTLDVEMPRMDGIEFLRKLMPQYPMPVVMVSALTERGKKITLEALEAGAIDFVTKPSTDVARGLTAMLVELRTKIKIAATARLGHFKSTPTNGVRGLHTSAALAESTDKVVVIGASTGGTEAIKDVICGFPRAMAGTVIVQHMPAGFTRMFADRLNNICQMEVREAEQGDRILPGRILVAPGGFQLTIVRSGGQYTVDVKKGELVCGHAPSVEVVMQSAAKSVGSNAIGVMLTGMGSDGASGLKAMRDAGARTLAQNEETCVVFGMPKEAWARGGAERLVPLDEIGPTICRLLTELKH
jgi:two-component system, chemotaxis family, protein-glutamate methylesterase/glutaminase